MAELDEAKILASMAVTGEEKLTFALRLRPGLGHDGELGRVMAEVAGGATYIVARTNTVVNARRAEPFEPAAVIMPWGVYEAMCADLDEARAGREEPQHPLAADPPRPLSAGEQARWKEARRG